MIQPAGNSRSQAPRNSNAAAPSARLAESVTTALQQQFQAAALAPPGREPADVLQVMQDVTGQFISNAVLQLKKRAADLCLLELEEYKRSKRLKVLTPSTEATASSSRPSSASYLIPTVTHAGTSIIPSTQDPAQQSSHPDQIQAPQFSQQPAVQTYAPHSADAVRADDTQAKVAWASSGLPHTSASSPSPKLASSSEASLAAAKNKLSKPSASAADGLQGPRALAESDDCGKQSKARQVQLGLHAMKPQWMHTLHAEPLPPWPQGPLPQGNFELPQAPLYSPALSFGKQPCAVMW